MGNPIIAACKNKRAGKTLSERRWKVAFSREGHLDIAGVLRRIQRGGIHPSIKGAVWEFLLGCFDPNSTFEERNDLRQRRREQYTACKSECQKIVPVTGSGKLTTNAIVTDDGQPIELANTIDNAQNTNGAMPVDNGVYDKKVVQWKLNLSQIGLDVVRTDRSLVFYENQANQAKLWDVLAVYAWMDKDIGYVQGMTDICSPMVILLENEADAFWCFERAMRRLVMWAMEYNPNICSLYDKTLEQLPDKFDKQLKRCGKFEMRIVRTGATKQNDALAIFLVASILGEMTGKLDAKKALNEALKVHKKYMSKASFFVPYSLLLPTPSPSQ
ncbi:unnamed protein product [Withania somnifera]